MMKHIALGLILGALFAFQASAQSFLSKDEIPEDLVVKLGFSSTIQFSFHYILTITAGGKVYFEETASGLPLYRNRAASDGKNKPRKPKAPKLADRLSKKQIREIIGEVEKSGFFEMNENYHGDPNLKVGVCVNHAEIKSLSVSANGKTKSVSFFLGCAYGEESPLKSFLALHDKINKELSGVKKTDLTKRQANAKK